MANSFPEQINNITGGLSLIGTDTRTFSEIADTNYDVNITMSGGKTLIVELIVHSGSIINTKTSYPEDSAFWIFQDGDIVNFSKIQGILTLSHDVKGYKIFNPIATRVKMDMSEDYYFSTAKGFSNSGLAIITITNTINVQFVINHLTTFTGTVTTNVYQ